MSETVTLEVPDQAAWRARAVAARTQRRLEDVLQSGSTAPRLNRRWNP